MNPVSYPLVKVPKPQKARRLPNVSDRTPGPWVVVKTRFRPWWKWWGPKEMERIVERYNTLGPAECYADAFGGSVRKARRGKEAHVTREGL